MQGAVEYAVLRVLCRIPVIEGILFKSLIFYWPMRMHKFLLARQYGQVRELSSVIELGDVLVCPNVCYTEGSCTARILMERRDTEKKLAVSFLEFSKECLFSKVNELYTRQNNGYESKQCW